MKQYLVLFLAVVVFFSCSKQENVDPEVAAFAALQGKYLVCESVVTTINGRSTTQVVGKGKGRDLTFGLYGNLDIHTTPVTTKSYQFQSPDKIYYWTTSSNSNEFYTVQSITSNKLVLLETDPATGAVVVQSFTAE